MWSNKVASKLRNFSIAPFITVSYDQLSLGNFFMKATLGIYKIMFACEKFNCIGMLRLFYSKAFVILHKSNNTCKIESIELKV